MTSGYVSGPGAEAIEEAVMAAERAGLTSLHLGPKNVAGMTQRPFMWRTTQGIDDERLAALYRRTSWVSGLRHVEGFEMPAIEGLACGARPILFDRPDMRQWYGDLAVYVPECSRDDLIDCLIPILESPPAPVTKEERTRALRRFNWQRIAAGFWSALEQKARKAA
jgi:glycosyltransferase involved in cell wall biosynthesis